ncbi:PQQ-binding-like beta-propeller repeat protein [Actinoplanes sp. NEAU-A12]|uniref:PQQ-binding-like beta-propeller repeat protein n=1 Tax=Actinoplanes sandaracinus TaxID=3045177 RepID=A0ABT6WDK6_9ACTN|nr:PQQ-binding-like beta-propeller repeat protein [Actinoplanes sandaracinus]MDI6097809.1 PQQ-binding-like beta-propeller repeat protein [Actinoplanes sandaracinus]
MSVSVIDLGDVSDPSARLDEYPPARRHEFDRATLRRLTTAVIAGVCALLLGGSALPGPPVLREVWSVPFSDNDSMSAQGGLLFVNRAVTGGSELTAYDMATGALRWTRASDESPVWIDAATQPGVILLPSDEQVTALTLEDGSVVSYAYGGTLTAIDPATGNRLWERPGMQVYGDDGDKVLLHESGGDGQITAFRLVGARDGSIVWEQRAPAGVDRVEVQSENGVAAHIVTATPTGEITVLRYSDGTTVASAQVPWSPTSSSDGTGSMIATAPGLVMVLHITRDTNTVTAYRATTLEELWTREFTDSAHVQDCGPVLCVGGGNFFTAVDPATGEARWSGDGNAAFGLLLPNDRLLVSGNDDAPQQTIVDVATGRPVGGAGRGRLLYRDDRTGALFLLRGLFPDLNRMAVSRLDPVTGRAVTLGALPIRDDRFCTGEGRYLACQVETTLTVTAVG